jgi:hypothetical protein
VSREYTTNKHGVEGYWADSGRFGHLDADGAWQSHIPMFVPRCCAECFHLDAGEFGDFGERLAGPYCLLNVWFPTRAGTCAKQEQRNNHTAMFIANGTAS